jgi:hypothetical protein
MFNAGSILYVEAGVNYLIKEASGVGVQVLGHPQVLSASVRRPDDRAAAPPLREKPGVVCPRWR